MHTDWFYFIAVGFSVTIYTNDVTPLFWVSHCFTSMVDSWQAKMIILLCSVHAVFVIAKTVCGEDNRFIFFDCHMTHGGETMIANSEQWCQPCGYFGTLNPQAEKTTYCFASRPGGLILAGGSWPVCYCEPAASRYRHCDPCSPRLKYCDPCSPRLKYCIPC